MSSAACARLVEQGVQVWQGGPIEAALMTARSMPPPMETWAPASHLPDVQPPGSILPGADSVQGSLLYQAHQNVSQPCHVRFICDVS